MLAIVPSATLLGVEGRPVAVECQVSNGLPGFTVVGLPDTACREARDRVRAALLTSELTWPQRRVTVNLAPSGIRKTGAGLDLPIAIALLVAIPIGTVVALYLSEFAPYVLRETLKPVLELLSGIRRAGADIIITYHAKDAARWLQ